MKLKGFKLGMYGQIVIDNYTRLKPVAEVDIEYDPETESLQEVIKDARDALNVIYFISCVEAIEEFECSGTSYNVRTLIENSRYASVEEAIQVLEDAIA